MALQITSTANATLNQTVFIYGPAKIGKTCLAATAFAPLILNADDGVSSVRSLNLPKIDIRSWEQFKEAIAMVKSAQCKQFKTIIIDDLTEVADQFLYVEKPKHKNTMQAYGVLNDKMLELIRDIRDIPGKRFVILCKQDKIKDELTGGMIYSPMIPGKAVAPMLPYMFGEVYHMELFKDPASNVDYRVLRTKRDAMNIYEAGSRAGNLAELESADLNYIMTKAFGPMA